MAGMASRYSSSWWFASWPADEAGRVKTVITGWMRNSSGKIAIPATTERLRRYSRSSLP
jgi:hypothetical protein